MNFLVFAHIYHINNNKHEIDCFTVYAHDKNSAFNIGVDFLHDWYCESYVADDVEFKVLFCVPTSYVYASLLSDMRDEFDIFADTTSYHIKWLSNLLKSDYEALYNRELL